MVRDLVVARAATVSLAVALLAASPAAAGDFSTPAVLRTAPAGVDVSVNDATGLETVVVVGWQERWPTGPRSFIRWTTDAGVTFSPREPVAAAGGQVAICDDFAWAVAEMADGGMKTEGHPLAIGPGARRAPTTRTVSPAGTVALRGPDLACRDRQLVTAWFQDLPTTAADPVMVHLRGCATGCQPGEPVERLFRAGRGGRATGLSVAATADTVVVVWVRDGALRLRRYSIEDETGATVTAHPVVTLATHPSIRSPRDAASGARVVVAWSGRDDTRVRVSDDGGASFGPGRLLAAGTAGAPAEPTSADIKGLRVLVEAVRLNLAPPGARAFRAQSSDGGVDWTTTEEALPGSRVGALFLTGGATRVFEAWDDREADPANHRIRSHHGPF